MKEENIINRENLPNIRKSIIAKIYKTKNEITG